MAQKTLGARVTSLENTVKSLEMLPAQVAGLGERMSRMDDRLGTVESQILELRTEMRSGFSAIREELATKAEKAELTALREEMVTKTEMKTELAAMREEMVTKAEWKAELAALREEMATKSDLATLEASLRSEIAESRVHTRLLFEEYVGRLRIVDERRNRPG